MIWGGLKPQISILCYDLRFESTPYLILLYFAIIGGLNPPHISIWYIFLYFTVFCYILLYFATTEGSSAKCDSTCEGQPSTMCGGRDKSTVFAMHMCNDNDSTNQYCTNDNDSTNDNRSNTSNRSNRSSRFNRCNRLNWRVTFLLEGPQASLADAWCWHQRGVAVQICCCADFSLSVG